MKPPTQPEIDSLSILYPGQYIGVANVSNTMFSIARYYGGMEMNGHKYTYFAEADQLWRDDFLKALAKHRKANKKPAEKSNEKLFPDLHP